MHAYKNLLRQRVTFGSLIVAGLFSISSGCQSRQLSWVGAQNGGRPTSTRPSLTEKQPGIEETPMLAQSHRTEGESKQFGSTLSNQPVQHASSNSLRGLTAAREPTQLAIFNANAHVSQSQVVQAQHASTPRYTPIGRSAGSENIPRIALATPAMAIPPNSNPNQQNGAAFSNASHVRSQGHSHADGKCNCGGSGVYKPVFPRFSGNSGCQNCGSASCSGGCGEMMCEQGFAVPRASDAQEYIFDGGDHDPKVRLREDLTQVGLDAEDTVIQFETVDGKTNVESGCRVAIYAPRFGSVRKRQSTRERDLAMRAQATLRPDGPGIFRDQLPPVNVSKPIKSTNSDNVRVVEAFRNRRHPMPAELVLPMVTVSEAFKPFEDLSLIRNGDLKTTDLARLAKSAAAARSWTNVDELNIIIDGQEAIDVTGAKKAADITIYEYKGARIRLCKVASDQMANPGDVISFTIRFDNVGEQPLKSLVVTDSLAPRLEYVEKSQQSSVAANFSISPNSVGSSVLRWELEDGLKPGDGGLVRFSCKVR
ncbi:MAG TPA: DUF11 domain-containing protein [Pirellula sp.]|nr:DUF11 domain-containing protein [Pirellula sp.]